MTKREAMLSQRLANAHRFIYGQMMRAKDYGSTFSEGVFVDCERFLKDNKAKDSNSVVVIPTWQYKRLMGTRIEQIKRLREVVSAFHGCTIFWAESDPQGTAHFLPQLREKAAALL